MAGKIIQEYSYSPGLDVVSFFDLALFSFVTGNAGMHLKNFSLISKKVGEAQLAPAYDLVATRLLPLNDSEEMALAVNGKKSNLNRNDFLSLGEALQIPVKAIENSFTRLAKALPKMKTILGISFLSAGLKRRYEKLIDDRAKTIGLG
jgi:serine/threonine-protein kinase HipA